jgi:hypothetical protein
VIFAHRPDAVALVVAVVAAVPLDPVLAEPLPVEAEAPPVSATPIPAPPPSRTEQADLPADRPGRG